MNKIFLLFTIFLSLNATAQTFEMVKDIQSGSSNGFSISTRLKGLQGKVYFEANDGVHGRELWISDGTNAGTTMLLDINPGSISSTPYYFTEFNGKIFFTANNATSGSEIWVTDGTTSGTQLLKDINPGSANSYPSDYIVFNNELYFSATDGVHGEELWKTDGTKAGTTLAVDVNAGSGYGYSRTLDTMGGKLYFVGSDGTTGEELWVTDGTSANTSLVRDIDPGPNGSLIFTNRPIVFNGKIFFRADDGTGSDTWMSDGTTLGTVTLGIRGMSSPTIFNNKLYFSTYDGANGHELWVSDGTPGGTSMLMDINSGSNSSSPNNFIEFEGKLYFSADNGTVGRELWVTDGTTVGTQLFKDINVGVDDGSPSDPFIYNSKLYFKANDAASDYQLHQCDGTAAGIIKLQPAVSPNTRPLDYTYSFVQELGSIFYQANYNSAGRELWKFTAPAPLAIKGITDNIHFDIYPNPANNKLTISSTERIISIAIQDFQGRVTKKIQGEKQIAVADLANGVYFIKIVTPNGSGVQKFSKIN